MSTMDEPADVPTPYAVTARIYQQLGWSGVLPLPPREKAPVPVGYTGNAPEDPNATTVSSWIVEGYPGKKGVMIPAGNVALRLPCDVLGVDVDAYDAKQGAETLRALEERLGPLPPTWRSTSRDDGVSGIRFYRVPAGLAWPGEFGAGIETIRREHRYAVVWPSVHPKTGSTYRWITPEGVVFTGIPRPEQLEPLPEPWVQYFTGGRERGDVQPGAGLSRQQVNAFLVERGAGEPCPRMQARLAADLTRLADTLRDGGARHEAARDLANNLVWVTAEGHPGGLAALGTARRAFLSSVPDRKPGEAEEEWDRLVIGAADKAAAAYPDHVSADPCVDPTFGLIPPDLRKDQPWQNSPATPASTSDAPEPSRTSSTSASRPSQSFAASAAPWSTSPSPSPSSDPAPSSLTTWPEWDASPSAATPATGPGDSATTLAWPPLPSPAASATAPGTPSIGPTDLPPLDPILVELLARSVQEGLTDEVRRLYTRDRARALYRAATEPEAPDFDLGSLREILARPPEPPMRVDEIIPWNASTLVVAQRKTGKTTMVLSLSQSLLTGQQFLGRYDVLPIEPESRIAILNFEVTGAQLARWAEAAQIDPDRLILVNLRGRRNPLGHDEDRVRLAEYLREKNVSVIIVDPFGRAFFGDNQNDNGQVQAFLVALDQFARVDVGALDLILTCHAGWDKEHEVRARGASALEDWPDTIIYMTKDKDGNRTMKATGRDVEIPSGAIKMDVFSGLLTRTDDAYARTSTSGQIARTALDELVQRVSEIVANEPGLSKNRLKTRLVDEKLIVGGGRGNDTLTDVLTHGEHQGVLRVVALGIGKPTQVYVVEKATSPTTFPTSPEPFPEKGRDGSGDTSPRSPTLKGGGGNGERSPSPGNPPAPRRLVRENHPMTNEPGYRDKDTGEWIPLEEA